MEKQLTPAQERERHVTMMQSPEDWPVWPCLPLKKIGGGWDVGLLLETNLEVKPKVYLSNMFAGVSPDTPTMEFPSFGALYDAGWRVD